MAWILVAAILAVAFAATGKTEETQQPESYTTMRCPCCGEEARVYGSTWECTWCGDFGNIDR